VGIIFLPVPAGKISLATGGPGLLASTATLVQGKADSLCSASLVLATPAQLSEIFCRILVELVTHTNPRGRHVGVAPREPRGEHNVCTARATEVARTPIGGQIWKPIDIVGSAD